ncbi:hypothetical protein AAHA92_23560 [Salvia divinorum]
MNYSNLDHEALVKNNAEEIMMRNPSSSSSSSPPIVNENPSLKSAADGVWNDTTKDPFGTTKIDEECIMKWQRLEMMQIVQTESKVLENGVESGKKVECLERRQRRMIKNRESAARSRARKQAYINQLQDKASQLQTSNKLLKKRKEVHTMLNSSSISAPIYRLRRINSAHF